MHFESHAFWDFGGEKFLNVGQGMVFQEPVVELFLVFDA
jgi:hypothetical protein